MKKIKFLLLLLGATAFLISCSDDDAEDDIATTTGLITEDKFSTAPFVSIGIVSATLEDGTTADCYQITFSSDGIDGDEGPFCPATSNDIGGLAMYDGASNNSVAKLSVINKALLEAIEADGYDIMDDQGNVYVDVTGNVAPIDHSNCLALEYDPDLTYTYLIPVTPKLASSVNEIGEVEFYGVSVDGVPMTGNPPSAVNGPSRGGPTGGTATEINFPSLDPCGGHPDPAGYYHTHFVPEVMNQVLAANGITDVTCTLIAQTSSVKLSGFAKDGFPVYAYATMPADLDACNGRTAATPEYPNGTYHYVASTTDAPNIPPCLKGVAARNSFQYN